MYINFKIFEGKEFKPEIVVPLCAIKQKELNWLVENLSEDTYLRLFEDGFTKHIKTGKKSDHKYVSLRLSDKGEQMLKLIEEAPNEEEDEKIFEWLKSHYLKAEKEIGNGARTKRHIRDFRIKSGIEKNNLIRLVLDFLKENEENSRVLEYVFYYPKTAFATRFTLEDSWLYKHYLKNEDRLKQTFEQY